MFLEELVRVGNSGNRRPSEMLKALSILPPVVPEQKGGASTQLSNEPIVIKRKESGEMFKFSVKTSKRAKREGRNG